MFDICNRNESIETDDTLKKKEMKNSHFQLFLSQGGPSIMWLFKVI